MALDLWFREDVARILAACWETMRATSMATQNGTMTGIDAQLAQAYERGFEDALRAVGVGFGITETHQLRGDR